MMQFPQVRKVVSQTGRPDDGTDVAGFYNNEFDVSLYPQEEWNPKISKDAMIRQMRKSLICDSRCRTELLPAHHG